jgi:hypothetical protein
MIQYFITVFLIASLLVITFVFLISKSNLLENETTAFAFLFVIFITIGYCTVSNLKHNLGWAVEGTKIYTTEHFCVTVKTIGEDYFYRLYDERCLGYVYSTHSSTDPTCEEAKSIADPFESRRNLEIENKIKGEARRKLMKENIEKLECD